MILNNIQTLITITENVVHADSDAEFSRNMENLAGMVKSTSPESDCIAITATVPSKLANYGPGLASLIANKIANH